MDVVINAIISILLLPIQLLMAPIDVVLHQIPGIPELVKFIDPVINLINSVLSTIYNFSMMNPILWNLMMLVIVLHLTLLPTINAYKKILNWIRGT